jgi:glycosyltransferase involved in cell wall biosynthesis
MDGQSLDLTALVVKRLAAKNPHIRLISEPDNGQSDAMNKGIALARGEVIGFLNVDDYYEPGVLNKAVALLKKMPKNTFLVANCQVWDQHHNPIMLNRPVPFDEVNFMVNYNFPFNPSAYFYHKTLHEKVGLYDVEDHYLMDIDFIFRMMKKAHIHHVDEVWGNYVQVEGSKTLQDIQSGRNLKKLAKLFDKYSHQLSFSQKIRLGLYRRFSGKNGWMLHYIKNPGQAFVQLKKKLAGT